MNEPVQYCTFYLDDALLGIDVQVVQEVIRHQQMTEIPMAPPAVAGLINLRGQIVTAIDLRTVVGLPALPDDAEPPMNMVVHTEGGAVSLLVDQIGDVLTMDPSDFEAPPETLPPSTLERVTGIYKLENELLLVLDPERAANTESRR